MDYSPAIFSHESDPFASPGSLPPTRTPHSIQSNDEISLVTSNSNDRQRFPRHPSIASRSNNEFLNPPASVSSFQFTPGPGATPRTADPTRPQPQLQNIVSTASLGSTLDLKRIALHAGNAEYNPKRFSAVIMRIRNPRTTFLIFQTGNIVCTGAKTVEESSRAARRCARIVQKLGFKVQFLNFRVRNIVGSVNLGFRLRLAALEAADREHCTYEAEIFPGLVYRVDNPKIALLVFESGKMVLTGAKEIEQIYTAFDRVYPFLKRFRYNPQT